MLNKNGKYFRKFTPEELFTEHIFSLMKQEKDIMVFPDNSQLILEDEIEEWNLVHGINDPTERILYYCIHGLGYRITHSKSITNVFVPEGMIDWDYESFIKQCEEDVLYRIE